HIADDLGNLGDLADGTPLEMVTDVIDGITGGTDGSPIDLVTGVIDGITGETDGSPIDLVTGVIDGITGGTDGSPIDLVTNALTDVINPEDSLGTVTNLLGSITGDLNGGVLDGLTELTDTISGTLSGNSLNYVTDAIDDISDNFGFEFDSTDLVLSVAEPTQTIISGGNTTIDILQDSVSTLFSDTTFDSINDLISITLNTDSDLANNTVDNLLTAITGTTSTITTVADTTTGDSSLTETVTPQTSLTNLTDNLFHSLSLF
ncbi:hypothetical protein, partial [Acinetobacter venetianus]